MGPIVGKTGDAGKEAGISREREVREKEAGFLFALFVRSVLFFEYLQSFILNLKMD